MRTLAFLALCALLAGVACSPKVTVEPPKEPIHVIVDVNIKHELYVKLDKEAARVIDENDNLF